jgi:hypothetical protein
MGADAFADENGVFEITVSSWTTHREQTIRFEGLIPHEKISIEIGEGRGR